MTGPTQPANRRAEFRFGKNSRIEIAPMTEDGTEPAASEFVHFCLTNRVTIGLSKGTVTIENFCIGGSTEVPDGTQTGELEFGDTTWTENDPAVKMLEDAAFANDERGSQLFYRVYPLGKGAGKPVFRGILSVNEWSLLTPVTGVITVTNGVNALGAPERGTQGAGGEFVADEPTP